MKVFSATVILAASTSAFGVPPEREISSYPFVATHERAVAIRANYVRVTQGMSPAEVAAVLGEADEVRPLYSPQVKSREIIGYTQWYVIRRLIANGSVNDRRESLVRVSFSLNDRVTRIDAWGL